MQEPNYPQQFPYEQLEYSLNVFDQQVNTHTAFIVATVCGRRQFHIVSEHVKASAALRSANRHAKSECLNVFVFAVMIGLERHALWIMLTTNGHVRVPRLPSGTWVDALTYELGI